MEERSVTVEGWRVVQRRGEIRSNRDGGMRGEARNKRRKAEAKEGRAAVCPATKHVIFQVQNLEYYTCFSVM